MCVSCPNSKEHSCKKAKKSRAPFSWKSVDQRTDGPTDYLTIRSLTSTDVENYGSDSIGPAPTESQVQNEDKLNFTGRNQPIYSKCAQDVNIFSFIH